VLLQNAADTYRALAEDRHVRLHIEILPGLSEVIADPERAGIVLSNFLSNALRYTQEEAQVVLSAQEAKDTIRFAVRDEGPGVPLELQAVIFEKFIQLPNRAPGAAGFGLFLAREIIKAHGGEIGVHSEEGKGAEFWFTLPIQRPANKPADEAREPKHRA
jgi:signal transduction histidine kinase